MSAEPTAVAEAPLRESRLLSDGAQITAGIVIVVLSCLLPELLGSEYWSHIFLLINIFIITAICQNVVYGDAGQASFGQGAIFGLAGYGVAIAYGIHGLPYPVAMLCGIAAALLGSLAFALPALRVQYFYLGFVTVSAAFVLPEVALAFPDFTGGLNGVSMNFDWMHRPKLLGVLPPITLLVGVLTIATLIGHALLRRSTLGRHMRVTASSLEAAQALGINAGVVRSLAFLVAGFGTGIAGSLYPPIVGFVSPQSFSLELSLLFFFAVLVGGKGALLGPFVGLWLLYLLPNALLAQYVNVRLLVYGVIALVVMYSFPDGIIGGFDRWRQKKLNRGRKLTIKVATILGKIDVELASKKAAAFDRSAAALEVKGGRKQFGQVIALDGVDFVARRGEIHGLVGANGSGKTTLLNVFSGFNRLDTGSLLIHGRDIGRLAPHRIARLGVGRTFQTPRIFPAMTMWENVALGLDARNPDHPASVTEEALRSLHATLGDGSPEWTSHGQRRLLEMVRVVLQEADILLLDEPASGLSPDERLEFSKLLRLLRDQLGKTIIIVEHDLDLVWGVADRITVLDAGLVVASGLPDVVARDPAVQHLFVPG
jgi:branched-chain amino acid transport system permease protein